MSFYITSSTKEGNSAAIFPPIAGDNSAGSWLLEFRKGSETEVNLLRIVTPGFTLDQSALAGWTQTDGINNPITEEEYDVEEIPDNWDNPLAIPSTTMVNAVDIDVSEITGLSLPFNFATPTGDQQPGEIQIYLATGSPQSRTFTLYDTYNVTFTS